MENVDKTINSICDWIQVHLEDTCSLEKSVFVAEMAKALALLVEARGKDTNYFRQQ